MVDTQVVETAVDKVAVQVGIVDTAVVGIQELVETVLVGKVTVPVADMVVGTVVGTQVAVAQQVVEHQTFLPTNLGYSSLCFLTASVIPG